MKALGIAIGSLSLALGITGIFVPLLPTTPFLLLSAALYFRSSPQLYAWLLHHKHLGPYIRHFREEKAIPLHTKVLSVTLLWGTIAYCIAAVVTLLWVRLLLGAIAIGVTLHILSFKTLRKK